MSVFLQFVVLPPPPDERPDDLFAAAYVARRFGGAVGSFYKGKCGTGGITPVSRDPWRAVRAQVEEELRRLVGAAKPAAEPKTRRISLVRRGPRKSAA